MLMKIFQSSGQHQLQRQQLVSIRKRIFFEKEKEKERKRIKHTHDRHNKNLGWTYLATSTAIFIRICQVNADPFVGPKISLIT